MFGKLDEVEKRFEQLQQQLMAPDVANDQNKYRSMMKELASLETVVTTYRDYKKKKHNLESSKEILASESDEDMRAMAKEEITELSKELEVLEAELKIALLPKDPNDEKDIILEIRAGAGGDEASLFAEELFRGYSHFATTHGWKVEPMSISLGNVGGYKEAIARITGNKVYSYLKFESGVHRVQRVPKTETQGRVHTSTVTVAVIPEVEPTEVKINLNEVRIDVTRSQGSGGQSVNTTDSAVRVTHLPTGIQVFCQVNKSQLANKEQAFQILYSKLQQMEDEKARAEASETRLSQIGTGDRSERIRTYNFPQSRITDHRIGFTTHQIDAVMNGAFGQLIEPLMAHHQAEVLKQQNVSP